MIPYDRSGRCDDSDGQFDGVAGTKMDSSETPGTEVGHTAHDDACSIDKQHIERKTHAKHVYGVARGNHQRLPRTEAVPVEQPTHPIGGRGRPGLAVGEERGPVEVSDGHGDFVRGGMVSAQTRR